MDWVGTLDSFGGLMSAAETTTPVYPLPYLVLAEGFLH